MTKNTQKSLTIAELNDILRETFLTGRVVLTDGIRALSAKDREAVLTAVRTYKTFHPGNNPHGERDFGDFTLPAVGKVFWKIDYYDRAMTMHSPNPADPSVTVRVLTIMLAEEY